jgi:23S rRNA (adenine2503-C2)-methyltransferase
VREEFFSLTSNFLLPQNQYNLSILPIYEGTQKIQNLIGQTAVDLHTILSDVEPYRLKQIYRWIYVQGVRDFAQMTNLPKDLRARLEESCALSRLEFSKIQVSEDGTQKWLFKLSDGEEIETVHIPEPKRGTLCISSQVGCTLTCKFCHTGTQTLVRNLLPEEILGQVMGARDVFGDWPTSPYNRHVSHIVMMGMGEPLYNYENVSKALKILMDPEGLDFSRRKITLSTSGVIPQIEKCGQELGVNLAVSLHAVRDDLRSEIIPLNKKYPLKDLIEVLRRYPTLSKTDRITFEYVMLKGVNDTSQDAKELLRLIRGIPAKINIIPFNSWPGAKYVCSDPETIHTFAEIIRQGGYASPLRRPRGEDILAACGQLKSDSVRKRKNTSIE